MKKTQVVEIQVTHIGAEYAFGVTQNGKPEDIFVPYDRRRAVESSGTSKASFSTDAIDYPRWLIGKGDIVVALIGNGDEKRRKAVAWAPKCVWEKTAPGKLCGKRGQNGFNKTAHQPASVIPKKIWPRQVVDLLRDGVKHLLKLDISRDKGVIVRVLSEGKQLDKGYGPLHKMLERDPEIMLLFANHNNVVEANINGRWVQIQNPFMGKIQEIAA